MEMVLPLSESPLLKISPILPITLSAIEHKARTVNLPPIIVEGSSSSMNQKFIPPEIIVNVLLRLPVKTIIRCKSVCKSWLELLETPEFAKDHLSRSVPGLIVNHDRFKIFEFVDEVELEHHNLHYNQLVEFEKTVFTSTPPHFAVCIEGSVNGYVLLCGDLTDALYICNPITREYIELPCLDPYQYSYFVSNGFGVCTTSGQYKVVRILQKLFEEISLPRTLKSECWIYTLGTRAWRSITMPCHFYDYDTANAFLNGILHWLVEDLNDESYLISCFDLETEVFSTFSPPPILGGPSSRSDPVVFEDCLCICDSTQSGNITVIWVMKEYGNENSWTKQFVFPELPRPAGVPFQCVHPLKFFEDGDILLLWGGTFLFYYSKMTDTSQKLDLFELREYHPEARLHVASFLSLRSFEMETADGVVTTPSAKFKFN